MLKWIVKIILWIKMQIFNKAKEIINKFKKIFDGPNFKFALNKVACKYEFKIKVVLIFKEWY